MAGRSGGDSDRSSWTSSGVPEYTIAMEKKVLIIEDDALLIKILSTELQGRGFAVESARNGIEGLEKFHSWGPSVILLDLLLPKMDGFKVCKAIKGSDKGEKCFVALMSGIYKSEKTRKDALGTLQADAFFTKPLDFSLLHKAVGKLFGEEAPAAEAPPERGPGLTGDLSETHVSDLLMGMLADQKTGHLDLSTGAVPRRIYVVYGYPVYVELGPAADNLGRILLQTGRITREDYERALKTMAKTRKKLGQILLDEGIFTVRQINAFMRAQVKEKLSNCFYYKSGPFSFTEREDFLEDILIYKIHPGEVILTGIKKFYTLQEIDEEIGPKMSLPVYFARGSSDLIKSIPLYPHEHDFLLHVKGGTPLLDIVSQGSLGLTETLKLIYSCLVMGILKFEESAKEDGGGEDVTESTWRGAPEGDEHAMKALEKRILEDYFRYKTADYFEMLDVDESSSREEIEGSLRSRLEFYTPEMISKLDDSDVREKAHELLAKIQSASDILTDDGKKGDYLQELRKRRMDGRRVLRIRSEFSFFEGKDLLQEGKHGQAEDKFREALRFNPESAEATAYLGWTMYSEAKDAAEAVSLLRKALTMDASLAEALYFLGRISKAQGDVDAAIEYFSKALESNPRFKEAEKEFIEIQK